MRLRRTMKIGILYNLVDKIERGFKIDALSDNEIAGTVELVTGALREEHQVIPVRARRELLQLLRGNSFDIIFNLCEGFRGRPEGEAWIAGLLEMLGTPYTGSGPSSLSLCLDKGKVKDVLTANNIPTPAHRIFDHKDDISAEGLKYPLIVKPLMEDASVGITVNSVVHEEEALRDRVSHVLENYRQPAIVEEYIDGRELNAAIIGNGGEADLLPISEIEFSLPPGIPRIVGFEAKWLEGTEMFGGTRGVCPAVLPGDVEQKVREMASRAFRLCGCRDYARVDFRLGRKGLFVLEVNPNPGINADSGFARSARTAGMEHGQLIRRILDETLHRYGMLRDSHPVREERYFESDGLKAREVRFDDIDTVLEWFNDPSVSRYMDDPYLRYSRDDLVEHFFVKERDGLDLMVRCAGSGENIGYCSIYGITDSVGRGEISFLIGSESHRGRGYGRRMVKLLCGMAFGSMDLRGLFASTVENNKAARRAIMGAGFRKVGVRRGVHFLREGSYNEVLFELTREDYLRKSGMRRANRPSIKPEAGLSTNNGSTIT